MLPAGQVLNCLCRMERVHSRQCDGACKAIAVEISQTEIADVLEIRSPVFGDNRGYFTEIHNASAWAAAGFDRTFVQDNVSVSAKGTLRELHYQLHPHGQGKLIRALRGSVFDVAVDIREGSPTFGKWVGRTLSEEDALALWVPAGFAHGFLVLEDNTQILYKCTHPYAPDAERTIVYNDPEIGIVWPAEATQLTDRDAQAPGLHEAERNFRYSDR